MESPLVVIFLAVISLTALLQAGCVAYLAFGLRLGNQKLGDFEETFETGLMPQIREAAKLTNRAAESGREDPGPGRSAWTAWSRTRRARPSATWTRRR
jgi:hypothetical protein